MAAGEGNCTPRFPTPTARGRAPGATRGLVALALLKHELPCWEEHICNQLRTDWAVRYAWGIAEEEGNRAQEHVVLPEVLPQFRRRLADPWLKER